MRPKVFPKSEAPTLDEYQRAERELFPLKHPQTIWNDEQRRQINRRARELMTARLKLRDGVH